MTLMDTSVVKHNMLKESLMPHNHSLSVCNNILSRLLCMPYITFSPKFLPFLYKASNTTVLPAEEGCLQYFTGVSGQIKSYNYDPGAGLQLSKQDYSICIRMERNFCGIQYTTCPDTGRPKTDQPLHRGPSAARWQTESLLHVGL